MLSNCMGIREVSHCERNGDCKMQPMSRFFQPVRSAAMVEDLDAGGGRGVYSSRSKLDIGDGHIECLSQFFDPRGMFNLFWLCLQGGPNLAFSVTTISKR